MMQNQEYEFCTTPLTEIQAVENNCLENDFQINNPVHFDVYNQLNEDKYTECIELIKLLEIENPEHKL